MLWLIPILFTVVLIVFLFVRTAPGSPWDARDLDAAARKTLDRYYGLDQPLWRQFTRFVFGDIDAQGNVLCGAICGNLGISYRIRGMSARQILFEPPPDRPGWESRFGYSLRLGGLAFAFALLIGIPGGIVSALNRRSWLDRSLTLLSSLGFSIPNFVVGLFLIVLLAGELHWIRVAPASWASAGPEAWAVPAAVLGLPLAALLTRITRASMLEVLNEDYVRTARAKGLRERQVTLRHVLRNALIPTVTLIGPGLAELITGAFVIESMFGVPGMASEFVNSVPVRDYPMVLGLTIVYASLVAVANLSVDVVYGLIDPRLRIREGAFE